MGGDFQAYGVPHLIALLVGVLGLGPAVWLGRRERADGVPGPTARGAGVVLLAVVVPLHLLDLLPGRFDLGVSLPFQLSDLAWMTASIALLTARPWAVSLTYYWGLTLTTQAVLTPSLAENVPHARFWAFWVTHLVVVWAAVHLVWGLGVRPTWRDYRRVVAVTAIWLIGVMVFNALTGTNYGYVNRKPSAATVLDYLGPWPFYVMVEVVVLASVWALMTWPWTRSRRMTEDAATRSG